MFLLEFNYSYKFENFSNIMEHPEKVEKYDGNLESLAQDVSNMRYDKVKQFIDTLADDIKAQADKDNMNGRVQLAGKLYVATEALYRAKNGMEEAWDICKKYMKD